MDNINYYTTRQRRIRLPITFQIKSDEDRQQAVPKQLERAVGGSQDVLMKTTTVFPFTLFPDTVMVDRQKLTVTHRTFFMVAEVMSIRIEDILNVTANVGPFFGSIKISTRFFSTEKPYEVHYFWRHDALRMKRIIQGYIVALQKNIDCSRLPAKQLATMLDQLGQGAPDEEI
ncbi:MAG TPA: hypothetical protein VMY99_01675 [Nevskiaceae bacterium]|nr:hypothetical protein [Nevskiaceae bacterium]